MTEGGRAGEFRTVGGKDGGYAVFSPKPLPPDPPLVIDASLQRLLDQANQALGRLDGITLLLPDPEDAVDLAAIIREQHGALFAFDQSTIIIDPNTDGFREFRAPFTPRDQPALFPFGQESAFHQDSRLMDIRDDKKLLWPGAPIRRLGVRHERLLDERRQALALDVWRLRGSALQEWQPRGDPLRK